MPADVKLDRHLSSLLNDLIRRLAGSGSDQIHFGLGDPAGADPESLANFEQAGLIAKEAPARSTICDGCGRDCPMEVTWPGGNQGPFIVCDKRDDIGRVPVDLMRLRQWSISMDRIASLLAALLATDSTPEAMTNGSGWRLGRIQIDGMMRPVRLATGDDESVFPGLTVSLVAGPHSGDSVSLAELLLFREGRLTLDGEVLARVFQKRAVDVAIEIQLVGRQIVLVNHVTGKSRVLARPDFNSVNDIVFETLFKNPGRTFTLDEIRTIARSRSLRSLSRIVEKLNFSGHLRQLFFEASKTAIRFKRTVAVGELAVLSIDPSSIR